MASREEIDESDVFGLFKPHISRAWKLGWLVEQDAQGTLGPYRIRARYGLFDRHVSQVIFTAYNSTASGHRDLNAMLQCLRLPTGHQALLAASGSGHEIVAPDSGERVLVRAFNFPPVPQDVPTLTWRLTGRKGTALEGASLDLPLRVERPPDEAAPAPGPPERMDTSEGEIPWRDVKLLLGVTGSAVHVTVGPTLKLQSPSPVPPRLTVLPGSHGRMTLPSDEHGARGVEMVARSFRTSYVMAQAVRSGFSRLSSQGEWHEWRISARFLEPVPPTTAEVEVTINPDALAERYFDKPVRWRFPCTPATT